VKLTVAQQNLLDSITRYPGMLSPERKFMTVQVLVTAGLVEIRDNKLYRVDVELPRLKWDTAPRRYRKATKP
jgi:hypothetical protein